MCSRDVPESLAPGPTGLKNLVAPTARSRLPERAFPKKRYKRCGKPGCKCATGRGHGPKYYLSVSRSGEHPQMDYVPQAYLAQVRASLANYHRTREILEEICAINRELLRRRERL